MPASPNFILKKTWPFGCKSDLRGFSPSAQAHCIAEWRRLQSGGWTGQRKGWEYNPSEVLLTFDCGKKMEFTSKSQERCGMSSWVFSACNMQFAAWGSGKGSGHQPREDWALQWGCFY